MANEAILMWETEIAVPINVADGTGIEKGHCLQLGDNFVGTKQSSNGQIFGGITKIEKIADDGNIKVAVYFGGIFKMVVGNGAATVGQNAVFDDAANTVKNTAADSNGPDGYVIGRFLQTAATGETVLVFVGKGHM